MKREEAIKDLDIIRFNPHWDELVNEEYWKELMEMAITALQNQPVWIPVSERLPELYQGSESHKQTNADKIRAMSDEELAEFIVNFDNHFGEEYEGEQSCLAWLQKESEE